MDQVIASLHEWVVPYGFRILAAVLIFIIGGFAAKIIRAVLRRILQRSRVDATLSSFVTSVCYVIMMAFVLIAAIGKLGVQTASFVAIIGAAGLAVGLALQGSLANFAAGVLLVVFKPYKIGDYIEGGGISGTVEEIGIFTTELKSPDNKKVIVPNAKITGDHIVNYTANAIRRVDIVAAASYADDIDKVKNAIAEILASDDRILQDPAPTIAVLELADSSVNFAVRPWVKTADYWNVFFALQEKIKKRFDALGICIPFPQRDVHIHQSK